MLWSLLIVVLGVRQSFADITGTTPSTGDCLCASGSGVNVRSTACGTVIGSISTGQCYTYAGTKTTCTMSGVSYEFFNINYGSGGWVAGTYLDSGSSSSCSTATGCPNIVSRSEWGARSPTSITYISQPIPRVFIHHTETASCTTQSACAAIVKSIQNYHMDSNGWSDIGYNFLVGEDGNAYEGRGWDRVGAHASNYNSVSLGISVIGSFSSKLPNDAALNVVQQLLSCGVSKSKVSSTYYLHGHRDGVCTDCPGDTFYNLIKTWSRFGGTLSGGC